MFISVRFYVEADLMEMKLQNSFTCSGILPMAGMCVQVGLEIIDEGNETDTMILKTLLHIVTLSSEKKNLYSINKHGEYVRDET